MSYFVDLARDTALGLVEIAKAGLASLKATGNGPSIGHVLPSGHVVVPDGVEFIPAPPALRAEQFADGQVEVSQQHDQRQLALYSRICAINNAHAEGGIAPDSPYFSLSLAPLTDAELASMAEFDIHVKEPKK